MPSAPPLPSVRALTLFWRLVNSGLDDLSNSYYGLLKASFIVLMYGNDSPAPLPALNLNQHTFVLSSCLFCSFSADPSFSFLTHMSPVCCCLLFRGFFFIVRVLLNSPLYLAFLFYDWLVLALWSHSINAFLNPLWYWEVGHLLFHLIPPVCPVLTWKALMELGTGLEWSQTLNIAVKGLFSTWYGRPVQVDTLTPGLIATQKVDRRFTPGADHQISPI